MKKCHKLSAFTTIQKWTKRSVVQVGRESLEQLLKVLLRCNAMYLVYLNLKIIIKVYFSLCCLYTGWDCSFLDDSMRYYTICNRRWWGNLKYFTDETTEVTCNQIVLLMACTQFWITDQLLSETFQVCTFFIVRIFVVQ